MSFYATALLWFLFQIVFALPENIHNEWMCWRQADTQTIAINFMEPGSNIFYPQINWRGDGPGYVEAEFQIYTYAAAQLMKFTGVSLLPGQLLSLISILLTSVIIFKLIQLRLKNYLAAYIGAVFFLVGIGAVHLGTSIQPDSMSVLFYVTALFTFLKYIENKKTVYFFSWIIFSILAGLIKPIALNVGIIQFLVIIISHREMLRSIKIWLGWVIVLLAVAVYMLFSYNIYLEYGNTFGILGGESKFPTLEGLMMPVNYIKILYMIILWGLGISGTLAFIYLLIKKKLTTFELSLLFATLVSIIAGFTYTISESQGPHYYIFMAVAGVYLVAAAFDQLQKDLKSIMSKKILNSFVLVLVVSSFGFHMYLKTHPQPVKHFDPHVTKIGLELKKIIEPNSRVVIRSIAEAKLGESGGKGTKNFEDPRIFYIAQVRGWSIPSDMRGAEKIEEYKNLGAKYYIEPFTNESDTELYSWLNANAELVYGDDEGRIYKFHSRW